MYAPPKIIAAIGTFFIINPALMPNCSIRCLVRSLASALRLFCSWRYKEVDVISNTFILSMLTTHNINDQSYQIAFDLYLLICQWIYPMSFTSWTRRSVAYLDGSQEWNIHSCKVCLAHLRIFGFIPWRQKYIYSNKHFTIEVNLIIVRLSLSSAFASVVRVVLMSYKTAW